tara:strand:- start:23880 stop:27038 length:3159 start_codon:yes stop_codon:yes gene_type:complete
MNWFPLNCHTHFSLLKGFAKPEELAKKCKEYGYRACALTDCKTISGAVSFYKACKKEGVKPIVGCEFDEFSVLAKNKKGWYDLIELVTSFNCDGFTEEKLNEVASRKNLICVSNNPTYEHVFGENYFSNTTNLNPVYYVSKEDAELQRILLCAGMRTTLPTLDKKIRNGEKIKEAHFFNQDSYYLPAPEEVKNEDATLMSKIFEACEEYDILAPPMLPKFQCPNGLEENIHLKNLCREGWKNLLLQGGKVEDSHKKEEYLYRVTKELDVILEANLAGYFLIVQDIVNHVRVSGWLPGPGRGSAAGCLISYLIGITEVDPIEHGLIFERFYNAGRNTGDHISLPDIDVDVPSEHRDEIIDYIKSKYGHNNVAQMITFGRLQGRAALKEVMRIEGEISFAEMNEVTKPIPNEADISDQLENMEDKSIIKWALLNMPEKLDKWCKINSDGSLSGPLSDTFEKAIRIEGTFKSRGKHAAGVIISKSNLHAICPMAKDKSGKMVAAFEMNDLESQGHVKFDILGIDLLSKIMKVALHGDLNLKNLDDPESWNLISDGCTKGVFQLESQLGRSWAKRLKPSNIEELAALVSLIRPGCLDAYSEGKSMTQHYVDRKHGREEVEYLHESLEEILSETYGVIVYQEQSMMIAQKLAGFDLQEADDLRKAIGKKQVSLMAKVKNSFLKGATSQGTVSKETAEEIFSWIEKSSRYAFNKSHAISYAIDGFHSAYCKAHNVHKFFEVYLEHAKRKPDTQLEIKELVNDAKLHNIEVLPPRLNHFYKNFKLVNDKIYFGIANVKNIGGSEAQKLCDITQEYNKIKPLEEWNWVDTLLFLGTSVNKRAMNALISIAAFNGKNNRKQRNEMLYEFDSWRQLTAREIAYIRGTHEQDGLPNRSFSYYLNELINNFKINSSRIVSVIDIKESLDKPMYSLADDINWIAATEEKFMGISLTCSKSDAIDNSLVNSSCKDVFQGSFTGKANLAVQINSIREYKIKNGKSRGKTMAFLSVEDGSATLDSVVIFPESYQKYKNVLFEGNTVIIMGKTSSKKDNSLIVDKVCES